ncbi:MAG: flagellar motor protein MotD [Pseudomonadales bacterium]|jgi:chemotaxis protein MotB|nr:flagellar motor protein MotD [Gammaproteobacteria bacterium]MBP6052167.1 flagellar motor protein MotD [Pseudomonadales bacterium]MBK6582229.1 flagellar motor protein MotD [Gammaproteobacteria bacterium]MBK7521498.1 flagellar motor protein MotD [Gammaproteobacteria bacterium]MBK8307692.1 flagellar motor protein MotD [Gammaproteobacteria bacterium]
MAKRVIHEDRISHERWMVSYADFLTLLLAFFVVMYSVSQVNEGKYRVLTKTLTEAFNIPERSINPIQIGDPVTAVMPGVVSDSIESPEQMPGSGHVEEEEVKATTSEPQLPEEFRKISQRVEEQFATLVDQDLLSVQGNEEWLEIELKSSLLFASGDARPSSAAEPIMKAMAEMVRDSDLPIRVEGFTDDRPIANDIYPSNWELSSARAASMVKLLTENGISPTRLVAVGYGEFQPIAANDSEAGRAENRRVVLLISRSARLRPNLPRLERARDPVADTTPPDAVPGDGVAAQARASGAVAGTTPAVGATPAEAAPAGVLRVELEGGGVLFTNDAARARRPAEPLPATGETQAPQ